MSPIEEIAVALGVVVLVIYLLAWQGTARLALRLKGKEGYRVASILSIVVLAITVSQVFSVAGLFLVMWGDDLPDQDTVIEITIIARQLAIATGVIWAFRALNKLSRE